MQLSPLLATGATQEEALAERERWRELLTFLYSTPSYWPSLELFGWKARGDQRLNSGVADSPNGRGSGSRPTEPLQS